jgi:ribosomal protein S18 acetylase RimI-like enzyme
MSADASIADPDGLASVVPRPATAMDLALLVRVDLEDEGVTPGYRGTWGEAEAEAHRRLIQSFVVDGGALMVDVDGQPVGAILWRARTLDTVEAWSVFRTLDAALFPAEGAFAEIFQLWVAPSHRRRGIATLLKRAVEAAARSRQLGLIYTHTEASHTHVLALNEKLGYREVRRGPLWDEVIRVSLIKQLA